MSSPLFGISRATQAQRAPNSHGSGRRTGQRTVQMCIRDRLYTLLEERGIKVLEEDAEPTLDVDSIMAEVENAENNNDDRCV